MNQNHLTTQYLRKDDIKDFLQIIVYYFLVGLFGIITRLRLESLKIPIDTIAPKESAINAFYIFGLILLSTLIIILIIRFIKKIPILKIIETFVSFVALMMFFSIFLGDLIGLLLSLILLISRVKLKFTIFRNIITTLVIGFIGGYISYSIGVFPIIILLVLVGIYDYIAVFKTKHMVYLAKNIVNSKSSFTFELNLGKNSNNKKTKEGGRIINIGTGDFALPIIAVINFLMLNIYLGVLSYIFVNLALIFTIWLLKNKKSIALPAIPLQAIGLIIVYIIYLLI